MIALEQYRVGTDPGAAEAAELARAKDEQRAQATERQIAEMVGELALVAGVEKSEVTVDRDNRRAIVQASHLPGLTVEGWRVLEGRVDAGMPGWSVELRPPLLALPSITLAEGEDNPTIDFGFFVACIDLEKTGPGRSSPPDDVAGGFPRCRVAGGFR